MARHPQQFQSKTPSVLAQIKSWSPKQKVLGTGIVLIILVLCSFILNAPSDKPQSNSISSSPTPLPSLVRQFSGGSELMSFPIRPNPVPVELPQDYGAILPMKVFRNEYLGFSLRFPEDWLVEIERDRISVCRDAMKSACTLIAPRRLREGNDLKTLLQVEFQNEQKLLESFGAKWTLGILKEGPEVISAPLTGSISGLRVLGDVKVYRTEAGAFCAIRWAPLEEWEALNPSLLVIRDSFESVQPKPMNLFQGQVFSISYPQNWRVDEGLYGIKVVSPDDESSFSANINIYLPGNPTPQEYLKLFERDKTRVKNLQVLSEKAYPYFIDKVGQRWQVVEREVVFDSPAYGRQRGAINGAVVSQGNNFSGIVTMRCASIKKWDELKATLVQIEGSFRITRPDRLGGGTNTVNFPSKIDFPGYESLPIPGSQQEHWDRG